VNIPDWVESLDTTEWEKPGAVTRVLVVANPNSERFVGMARLEVDFRTRGTPPVCLETQDEVRVPCRVVDQTLGPVEVDGKRRWRFGLLFPVDIPAKSVIAVRAVWGEPADETGFDTGGETIPAWETTCHHGPNPIPGSIPDEWVPDREKEPSVVPLPRQPIPEPEPRTPPSTMTQSRKPLP